MRIREAQITEKETVSQVMAASWRFAYRGLVNDAYLSQLPDTHWVQYLEKGLRDASLTCMVAEESGQIIATALLRTSVFEGFPQDGEMVSLYFLPTYIGKGLGRVFLAAIEDKLRAQGYTHVLLNVLEGNSRALRFYERCGYAPAGTRGEVSLGAQTLGYVLRRKAL